MAPRARAQAAAKKAKEATAESAKEHEASQAAQERVLKGHTAAVDKIVAKAEADRRELLSRQLDLGGVVKEIARVAQGLQTAA